VEIADLKMCTPDELHFLGENLAKCHTVAERWAFLAVKGFDDPAYGKTIEERLLFAACRAVGQWELIAEGESDLVDQLLEVERFYAPLGGVVGYQAEALASMRTVEEEAQESCSYGDPELFDIREDSPERRKAVLEGIYRMGEMAEIYPVGGTGDRLGLRDEIEDVPLPVGALHFNGANLLTHLFHDLEARERLYRDLTGKEIVTPVVLMVSNENQNDRNIERLCEEADWFGRPKESFYFVVQPSVPVVTGEGKWVVSNGKLVTRPGGHGVLWRVMEEQGAFDWLESQGRTHALLRQINNPLAATDCNMLALSGRGWLEGYLFGFATCPRKVGTAEGTIVSFEHPSGECGISNIEYTEFTKLGMEDEPSEPGGEFSRYPANTNILFADLQEVRRVALEHPFPGRIINLTKKLHTDGGMVLGGRLETTMQNVADHITSAKGERAPTFVTYGQRGKTLSVTKRAYEVGGRFAETPPGCFFDQLHLFRQLLTGCGLEVAEIGEREEYLARHPGVVAYVDPVVGPLWSTVAQKVRGGSLASGSHLDLRAPQIDWEGVELDGSLQIKGEGSITLRDVKVENRGVDFEGSESIWKGDLSYFESTRIEVEAGGELYVEGVTLEGEQTIHVASGQRLSMTPEGTLSEPLTGEPWRWTFQVEDDQVVLSK